MFVGCLEVIRHGLLAQLQVEAEAGKQLAQFIVNLASQMTTFFFPGGDQLGQQLAANFVFVFQLRIKLARLRLVCLDSICHLIEHIRQQPYLIMCLD